MKKFLFSLTDRKWIPVCLMNGWVFKLLGIMFIIFFILFLVGLAMSQEFPY